MSNINNIKNQKINKRVRKKNITTNDKNFISKPAFIDSSDIISLSKYGIDLDDLQIRERTKIFIIIYFSAIFAFKTLNLNIRKQIAVNIEQSIYKKTIREFMNTKIKRSWNDPVFTNYYNMNLNRILSNKEFIVNKILSKNIDISNIAFLELKDIDDSYADQVQDILKIKEYVEYKEYLDIKCRKCNKQTIHKESIHTIGDEQMIVLHICNNCGFRF